MQLEEEVAFIFRTVFQRTVQIKPKVSPSRLGISTDQRSDEEECPRISN